MSCTRYENAINAVTSIKNLLEIKDALKVYNENHRPLADDEIWYNDRIIKLYINSDIKHAFDEYKKNNSDYKGEIIENHYINLSLLREMNYAPIMTSNGLEIISLKTTDGYEHIDSSGVIMNNVEFTARGKICQKKIELKLKIY